MLQFPSSRWNTALRATDVNMPRSIGSNMGCASPIIPRLYLSGYFTARDSKELERLGITHVISIIEMVPEIPECIPHANTIHIPLADRGDANILDHLPHTTDFIKKALSESENNKVLVHCFQGISRSATIVCAYLVATQNMPSHKAIEFVQSKRGIVCPNLGFREQLEMYGTRFVGTRGGVTTHKTKISYEISERIKQLKSLYSKPY